MGLHFYFYNYWRVMFCMLEKMRPGGYFLYIHFCGFVFCEETHLYEAHSTLLSSAHSGGFFLPLDFPRKTWSIWFWESVPMLHSWSVLVNSHLQNVVKAGMGFRNTHVSKYVFLSLRCSLVAYILLLLWSKLSFIFCSIWVLRFNSWKKMARTWKHSV